MNVRFDLITTIVNLTKRLSLSQNFLIVFFLATFLLLTFWANTILLRFPNTGSERTYVYQAQTFLKGRLWNTPPPPDFFNNSRIIVKDGKYIPKTFPGWSILLSMAMFCHFPTWMLNPLIATLSLFILFLLAKLLYNETIGLFSVVGALCSPFFIFNAATYEPNISCGLLTLLAIYFYCCFNKYEHQAHFVFLIGLCLGFAYLIRPFSTLSCLVPVLIALIANRKSVFFQKEFWLFLLGIVPFFLISFLYNHVTTGNYFLSPFNLADPHDTVRLKLSTILGNIESVENQFLWMNPAIFGIYFIAAIYLIFKKRIQVPELIFFILVGACFFYFVPGGYGDRYYYEGYLLCVFSVIGWQSHLKAGLVKQLLSLTLMAGLLTNVLIIPAIALSYHQTLNFKSEVYCLVKNEHLSNAIVFVPPEGKSELGVDIRNDPDLQNPVLYANDLKEKNIQLLKYFPTRDFYRYDPAQKEQKLKIKRIFL